jgi:hypothetical protein
MPMPNKTASSAPNRKPATTPPPTPPAAPSRGRHSADGKGVGVLIRLILGAGITLVAAAIAAALGGPSWFLPAVVAGVFFTFMIAQRSVPGIGYKLLSFSMCHPAGFFLAASFLSPAVSWPFTSLFNLIPGHQADGVGTVLLVLGYVFMAIDGLRRGPDTYAVWAGVILPCLSGTIGGSFGHWLLHYGNDLRDWITGHTAPTIGNMSMFALGLLFFMPMLYFRHCYHQTVRPGNGYAKWLFRQARVQVRG